MLILSSSCVKLPSSLTDCYLEINSLKAYKFFFSGYTHIWVFLILPFSLWEVHLLLVVTEKPKQQTQPNKLADTPQNFLRQIINLLTEQVVVSHLRTDNQPCWPSEMRWGLGGGPAHHVILSAQCVWFLFGLLNIKGIPEDTPRSQILKQVPGEVSY